MAYLSVIANHNPLSAVSVENQIPVLQARGVRVFFSHGDMNYDGTIDNFFVSESLGKYGGLYASAYEARIGVSWDALNHIAAPQKLAMRRG